ncbi:DeoR family transcriptional regulator, partial [Hominenteromicrobium sp.]
FPVTAIAAVLSRSSMTVKRSLNELETAGLIMRVRQGIGEPNRIYVLIPGKEDAALA